MFSLEQLQSVCTTARGRARCVEIFPHMAQWSMEYNIDTPERLAAFIAQVMHESVEFRYLRELGGDAYLAKYDTGRLAEQLGNTPGADGDGQKYCGRGLIQITGRKNYWAVTNALGIDLIARPELLEQPDLAVRSACWWWDAHGLNDLADAHDTQNFYRITRIINGGLNGIDDRVGYWERARSALNLT